MSESEQTTPEGESKGDATPVAPRGEGGDVAAGHQPPETRGHRPPRNVELGHQPPEDVIIVQQIGEMHSPAKEAPPPTAPPPKPSDSAQSVTPPEAHESSPPPSSDGESD
jgi:hypothetical protein